MQSNPAGHGDLILWRGIKLVARYGRVHPLPLTLAILGATLFATMTVLGAMVLGWLTDEVIRPGFDGGVPTSELLLAAGVVIGVAVLRAAGVATRRWFAAMTSRRMQVTWRDRLVESYVGLPLARVRQISTGELLAHVDNDVIMATEAVNPFPFAIGTFVLIVFASVQLALIDAWMLVVALLLFPAIAWLSHVYSRLVVDPAAQIQARVGAVSAIAHESIDGALVVKTLGRERAESDRFEAESDQLRRVRVVFGDVRAVFEPLLDSLPSIGAVVLLVIGAWRVSTGDITAGQVVQALALLQVLAFPMRVLGFFLEMLPQSLVASGRLDALLAEPTEHRAETGVPLPQGPLSVVADDLTMVMGGRAVLDHLSLQVEPGEVVALVGATGSGKSTLLSILAGLARPDAGTVAVGGVALDHVDRDDLARRIALVFQESYLFTDTIGANIDLGAAAEPGALQRAAEVAQAHAFVQRTMAGYDTVVGERGVTLSGGQRQRVALARALFRRPQLVLLDDATSAVDPVVEEAILAGLRQEIDTTALIVAHRLSTIALADRVLYLAGGRVVATGTHEELLATQPAYAALVRAYQHRDEIVDEGAP
jgi:ATP-binding cassette, subfamily B, bacterial